ncbi:MAG: amidase [Thaumarchaeota archaeon]|nr:amidase [Nitrososphaerota archaeon]
MKGQAAGRQDTIRGLSEAYREGSASPLSVAREQLSRIESLNPRLNAFITTLADSALKAAEESERRFKAGTPLGPLDGVPIAVKDIIYIQGVRCTAGSKILANNIAMYDAPVVRKLRAAGAVIFGTTNLHEFAAGTTSVNPHYGAVRNPWDERKVSGGSSGGSAVAVASGMAAGALGTDTAGSIRIPAALCGVVGLKPTYGRVSRLGVIPLASSLDTVGVMAASAWDSAALLQAIAGHDKEDMTTTGEPMPDLLEALSRPITSAKVGLVGRFFHEAIDPAVEANFGSFVSRIRELGLTVEDADLDGIDEVYGRWLPIRRAEATAFHLKWLESSPELYGEDVRKLLELGKDVLAVDYVNAVNARPSYMERFTASMKDFDLLAVPCTAVPAPLIGQTTMRLGGNEVPVYSALNRLTLPFNYVGFPVLSIPSGMANGTPLGVQLVGKLFDEATILRVADAYERKFGLFPTPASP